MNRDKQQESMMGEGGSYVVKKNKKLNILAFVLCVLVSFFVWIYVMNTQNSNYTKTFSIAVETINEEALLEKSGLTVFGEPEVPVTVTIQGKKADIQKFSEKDFRAYIDVLTVKEAGNASVSVGVETPTSAVSVIEISPKTANVFADELDTVTVPITAFCEGYEDELGLAPLDVTHIDIRGPKSFVDDIKTARVAIPYSEDLSTGKIVISSDIRLYDEKKNQLSSLYMIFGAESVSITVVNVNGK